MDQTVAVTPGQDGTTVDHVSFTLQAGQSRRVSDQLTITLSHPHGGSDDAEVDNNLECLDPATNELLTDSVGGGTNHPKSGAGPLSMRASLLFTAPYAGTFDCRIRATTSDGANTNYQVTALSGPWPDGTWLELDNFTADVRRAGPLRSGDSKGTDDRCLFLGKPVWGSNPATAFLYADGPAWSAAPDAVTADPVGHMQITSCYYGTASCPPIQWGDVCFRRAGRRHRGLPHPSRPHPAGSHRPALSRDQHPGRDVHDLQPRRPLPRRLRPPPGQRLRNVRWVTHVHASRGRDVALRQPREDRLRGEHERQHRRQDHRSRQHRARRHAHR